MGIRRWMLAGGLVMAGLWCGGMPAAADTAQTSQGHLKVCPVCGRVIEDDTPYAAKAGSMLTRGAANTVFGWTELIRQPAAEAKAGGSVLTGIGKGVGEAVKRTFGGVGEMLMFWTPKVNQHYLSFSNDCPVCVKNREKYGASKAAPAAP